MYFFIFFVNTCHVVVKCNWHLYSEKREEEPLVGNFNVNIRVRISLRKVSENVVPNTIFFSFILFSPAIQKLSPKRNEKAKICDFLARVMHGKLLGKKT